MRPSTRWSRIAHLHQTIAPYLLGKDPLQIDKHSRHMLYNYLGFKTVGAEMRAASAVDIALWDLLGQVTNQPIYQLLGGASRDTVRAYNTCAGYQYVRAKSESRARPTSACPAKADKKQPLRRPDGLQDGRGNSWRSPCSTEGIHRNEDLALR